MTAFYVWWCWMVFRVYLKELLKRLMQSLRRLWGSSQVQRIRWALKLALRVMTAILIFRLVIRLGFGQIAWATFLDDLTINLIASGIVP
jgi:hypothetical protein